MRIDDKALDDFMVICEEEYGLRLSREEARVRAIRLLLFYELIYRPLPFEKLEATRCRVAGVRHENAAKMLQRGETQLDSNLRTDV